MQNAWLDPATYFDRFSHWRFKNTSLLLVGLAMFFYAVQNPAIQASITRVGELGYLGAFITGIFFTSVYTIAPAAVILVDLAQVLNPWGIAILGGLGGVLGDYIIFRYLRDGVFKELLPALRTVGKPVRLLFRTPYFAWLIPIIGALVIASPLPDEVGIGLLGVSRIRSWQFLLLTFALNTLGIFTLIFIATAAAVK